MNLAIVLATTSRVLSQLRRDRRTVALIVIVPSALVALMRGVFDGQPQVFQRVGVPMLGIFPLLSMFLVTSITMLRERTTGTLERLMTMPVGRLDLLVGYGLGFGLLALVQVSVAAFVGFGLTGLEAEGPLIAVVALAVLNSLLGMSLGLFVSAFARTEFQAVQFMPAIIMPQFLLSGMLTPREAMIPLLEAASDILPMSYAYDGLTRVAVGDGWSGSMALDVVVVMGAMLAALVAGAATLQRRTA